jgi:hypothetical protein
VLEFAQAGGTTTKKDPVYMLLVDGQRFSRLLHEAPLYLLRRSLLKDDAELFRRSIRLYRTRNRLSRGQAVTGNEDYCSVDQDGALESLDTAIRVFQWFGIAGYVLPVMDQERLTAKKDTAQLESE